MRIKVHHQHLTFSIPKRLKKDFFCIIRYLTITFPVFTMFSVTAFAETVLTEADCGKTIPLKSQEEVMVSLPSNPTTGYGWAMVEEGKDAAVVVVSKEFRTSASPSGSVGAGGVELFRLRLLKAGRFTVTFVYRRSWEKEREPERVFRIVLEEQ
jgi:inhibitor of cysteine peptidase